MISRELFSPAKINLILRIGRRRRDGYHEIASLMAKLSWGETLKVRLSRAEVFGASVRTTGLQIPLEKNLVFRAAELFSRSLNKTFQLEVELKKNIPSEAGLGGGSSNAASILKFLGEEFGISRGKLQELAAHLGSDIPFFLAPTNAAWCLGRGERCTGIEISSLPILVAQPKRTRISTGWAYSRLDSARGARASSWPLETQFPDLMGEKVEVPLCQNDFEPFALKAFPELRKLKGDLIESGAVKGQMTGSGSCFFGVYADLKALNRGLKFMQERSWRCFPGRILDNEDD